MATILEFLQNPRLQLPVQAYDSDLIAETHSLLKYYCEQLDSLESGQRTGLNIESWLPQLKQFCNHVPEIYQLSFEGHPSKAFSRFCDAMQNIDAFVKDAAIKDAGLQQLGLLYRLRESDLPSLPSTELFHIPFELRYRVKTQRYSIPGLPCLYLSGSIDTCWAELGRIPFHKLHVSCFWLDEGKTITLLNFSDRPKDLAYMWTHNDEQVRRNAEQRLPGLLRLWPLMALCSISVKYPNADFKAEYVFPQYLLQWITKDDEFDGIIYSSTHVNMVTEGALFSDNIVLPSRQISSKGRCPRLRQLFRMTSPQSWQLLRSIMLDLNTRFPRGWDTDVEFVDGFKEPYIYTEFGKVESRLRSISIQYRTQIQGEQSSVGTIPE